MLETSGDHLTQNKIIVQQSSEKYILKKIIGLDKSSVSNLIN